MTPATPRRPPTALETRILSLLLEIAPDVEAGSVDPEQEFRDQFDFDSMDLFNFAVAIHGAFNVDIPERDYRNLTSLRRCAAYLEPRLREAPG